MASIGLMAPITNRVKFGKYFWSLFSETNIFAFEIKVILGLKSTCPDGRRPVGWSAGLEKLKLKPTQPSLSWDWGGVWQKIIFFCNVSSIPTIKLFWILELV